MTAWFTLLELKLTIGQKNRAKCVAVVWNIHNYRFSSTVGYLSATYQQRRYWGRMGYSRRRTFATICV